MSRDFREELLASVRQFGQTPRAAAVAKPVDVEPGQIRMLRAYDDDLDSMLVLVQSVDEDLSYAKVIGAISPVEDATVRNLVIERAYSEFQFDLALRVDAVATVWLTQLSATPVVGSVPPEVVDLARVAPRLSRFELARDAEALGLSTGSAVPQTGDPLWWSIGAGAEHLAKLSDSCHEALLREPVADPAILPSLIMRASRGDMSAAVSLKDAIDAGETVLTSEGWEACREPLARTQVRNPDMWRLLQLDFLESALRNSPELSAAPMENPQTRLAGYRALPAGLVDPLEDLVSISSEAGESSSRIWTSSHLWASPSRVIHSQIQGRNHALIAEFDESIEETR